MIITNKIKEAFPILNSIDDSLLATYPGRCYCIVNTNNQFSIRVLVMNEYVPRIFESLGKPMPYDLESSLDLTESLHIDLNSIENNNVEVHMNIPDYFSDRLEKFAFNVNTEYNIDQKLDEEGNHIVFLKFNSLNLVEYCHYSMPEESKIKCYRFSADKTLIACSEINMIMEPSNEDLINFHSVFEDFDREEMNSMVCMVNGPTQSFVMVMSRLD